MLKRTPIKGATYPSAKSSDGSGDRHTRIKNEVGMGMKDATGSDKQYNSGKTEGVCYQHKKEGY